MTNKSYIMADYELYDHDMNQIDHDMNQMKKHNLEEAHGLFFTTLANINRLKIIYSLRKQTMNVSEILKRTGLNQTTASHNLNRLKRCGFVTVEKKGKHRYYQLNKKTILPLMILIDKHVENNCSRVRKVYSSKIKTSKIKTNKIKKIKGVM